MINRTLRLALALVPLLLLMGAPAPAAEEAGPATQPSELASAIEQVRADMRLPGLAVVVVKDDQIVLCEGFGLRDVENDLPVTADTLFAIGSCTKAFTAMGVGIAQEEGKLSLDDSPKKYLPYFKLRDPEADEKVALRDMLCHRTGLGSTDLAWYTGVLTRDEVIRVAGQAKPTAPLRSKWQYQNVMYSAAGEASARACGTTWEQLIDERILAPLGMRRSNLSVAEMQASNDFARGYMYDLDTRESRLVPTRDLTNIAPAGAINSSARDMTQWLRLLLGRGEIDGRRMVSETMFDELTKPCMEVGGGAQYALGWLVHDWHGARTLTHSGGIDGFSAHVVVVPEKKLAFAILLNSIGSHADGQVREVIWSHLVEPDPATAPATAPAPAPADGVASTQPAVDPQEEVGNYGMLEVVWKDDSLWAIVPGQPRYRLERVEGRRYRLANAPPGFFVTFRDNEEVGTEAYLEQPHGNYALPRQPTPEQAADAVAKYAGPNKDLIGAYRSDHFALEVTVRGGKVVAIVKGQPTYTMVEKEKDVFKIPPAPDGFEIHIRRDEEGHVTGMLVKQPHGDMELTRANEPDVNATPATQAAVDEIVEKAVAAAGGEENLRKHEMLKLAGDLVLETQGLTGTIELVARAPVASTRTMELVALGKPIGTITETFDGTTGRTEGSFLPTTPYTREQVAEARALADFYGPAGWNEQFESITLRGSAPVGEEECHVLELKPATGPIITAYVSKDSHLVVRRSFTRETSGEPVAETYADWREVGGVKLPFRVEQSSTSLGTVVQTTTAATFD